MLCARMVAEACLGRSHIDAPGDLASPIVTAVHTMLCALMRSQSRWGGGYKRATGHFAPGATILQATLLCAGSWPTRDAARQLAAIDCMRNSLVFVEVSLGRRNMCAAGSSAGEVSTAGLGVLCALVVQQRQRQTSRMSAPGQIAWEVGVTAPLMGFQTPRIRRFESTAGDIAPQLPPAVQGVVNLVVCTEVSTRLSHL
eukprot:gnl/TRDRNA2_/TRDRNA2_176642_c0_seq2.p2 gnl/TRDRNA2_/TRDRNA2_176642_c0~~gnl/TRDRNA2_/TRDRNA2_176642_c0_seq2.p2  ORF type:complete len:199 (-),score=17.14 gnl/TRDRNA2_/TRDRNA2_176642_c0_seq2:557-1153(-)